MSSDRLLWFLLFGMSVKVRTLSFTESADFALTGELMGLLDFRQPLRTLNLRMPFLWFAIKL